VLRGCEVLRHVLPLRIGLEDIAVGADVALLVAVNVTILAPGCLRGRARAWNDALLFVQGGQLFLVLGNYLCACPAASIIGAANAEEAVVAMAFDRIA
jgi:hypothetical protein